MTKKQLFMCVMITAIAIIVSLAIIFLPVSAYSGNKEYQENVEISFEVVLSPEDVAKEFYGWYLAYIGNRSSGEFHNPLVDGAYKDNQYLSSGFISELDKMVADGIAADPILLAQDIPQEFSVDRGRETGTVIVHLQFGSSSNHDLKLTMINELGSWKINKIEQMN